MSKHTPAPWKVVDNVGGWDSGIVVGMASYLEGESSHHAAHMWTSECDTEDEENLANARLIAAAPDLLDAIQDLKSVAGHELERRFPKLYARILEAEKLAIEGRDDE